MAQTMISIAGATVATILLADGLTGPGVFLAGALAAERALAARDARP